MRFKNAHRRAHDSAKKKLLEILQPKKDMSLLAAEMAPLIAQARQWSITEWIYETQGNRVTCGVFKGMVFEPDVYEGNIIPRVLGIYEGPVQGFIASVLGTPYDNIVNVGCAEGYYAVGLALKFPATPVFAFEKVDALKRACRLVAGDNGVEGRLHFGDLFDLDQARRFSGRRNLLICDIEGGEFPLFSKEMIDVLAMSDLIVEVHPTNRGDVDIADWFARFASTHEVTIANSEDRKPVLPSELQPLGDLSALISICEFRGAPTPWAFFRSRATT
jgi:hypothetical protein